MKKTIISLFNFYKKLMSFLTHRHPDGTQNSFIIVIALMLAPGILHKIFPSTPQWIDGLCWSLICILLSFFMPISKSDVISFITHKKSNTPKELFKQFSHISFVFFLLLFSCNVVAWLLFIWFFICTIFELNTFLDIFNSKIIISTFIIVAFIVCFFYFCYHIYINPSKIALEKISLTAKLYAAIISTLTFIVGIVTTEHYFRLFLSGLALIFSWIQYIITSESKVEKSDTSNTCVKKPNSIENNDLQ